jgi:Flp pilus assembly protein TadB
MSKAEEISLEEQVERIRRKRQRYADHTRIRQILNSVFLLLAAIGLVLYFLNDSYHIYALVIIGVGMLLKIVEFFIRFVL